MKHRLSPRVSPDAGDHWMDAANASALFSDDEIDPDDLALGFHVIDEGEDSDEDWDVPTWREAR
jgi:hypothetical protein